jgi:diguanylate cyclase (GGDEF)-like protein
MNAFARQAVKRVRSSARSVEIGALCVGAIAIVGWVDVLNEPEMGLSLFYLVPILAAGWWLNVRMAIVCAVFAAACWFAADVISHRDIAMALSIWNAATRLAIYVLVGTLFATLKRDRYRLQESLRNETTLARTDFLTGLPNTRAFLERLKGEVSRVRRRSEPVCVGYVDLDNFKKVNDMYGHLAGDGLLKDVARTITQAVRSCDDVGRLGGDEFGVLLVDTSADGAPVVGQRLVDRVSALASGYPGAGLGASVGIAFVESPPDDVEMLLREADRAAYEAKSAGKARVAMRVVNART